MKNLVMYTNHYYPEQTSMAMLCKDLCEGLAKEFHVTVICSVPCSTGAVEERYRTKKYFYEEYSGIKVVRVSTPSFQKGNKISRIRNIITYFFKAVFASCKIQKQDIILVESWPPILGGLIGVFAKWINRSRGKKPKLVYHIQDMNPEQIEAVGYFRFRPLLWILKKLDIFSCRQSALVIVPGRDLVETLEQRFIKCPEKMPKVSLVHNWVDETEIYPLEAGNTRVEDFKTQYGLRDKFIFEYSGNLGYYYDLMGVLKVIQKIGRGIKAADGREVFFVFIGEGTQLDRMQEYVGRHHMDNVCFIPYQKKENLLYTLNAADVHLCINAKGIKGVSCPSKYYGIAAAGKPLLGVLEKDSEIRCLIEETKGGLVCEPKSYSGILENMKWFISHAGSVETADMGRRSREHLVGNLTKEKSIGRFVEEIRML